MFLLDTDILSLLFGGHLQVTNRSRAASTIDLVATSFVSRIEILQGRFDFIRKAADENELRRACAWLKRSEAHLSQIQIVDLNDDAFAEYFIILLSKHDHTPPRDLSPCTPPQSGQNAVNIFICALDDVADVLTCRSLLYTNKFYGPFMSASAAK